jgi:antitoxin (DNA-binding transcriptional repressor) of toxin-antitoxin stability system
MNMQKANIVGLKELRENMETYITRIKKGESITVFRRTAPIFKLTPIDAEESCWETVIDFTEVYPEGVSGKDIIAALQKMHG